MTARKFYNFVANIGGVQNKAIEDDVVVTAVKLKYAVRSSAGGARRWGGLDRYGFAWIR